MSDSHHLLQSAVFLPQGHLGPASECETEVQDSSQQSETAGPHQIPPGDISRYQRLLRPGGGQQTQPGPALQAVQCGDPWLPPTLRPRDFREE